MECDRKAGVFQYFLASVIIYQAPMKEGDDEEQLRRKDEKAEAEEDGGDEEEDAEGEGEEANEK